MNGRRMGALLVFVAATLAASPAIADETPADPIVGLMDARGLEQHGLLVEAREAMLAVSRMPSSDGESALYAEAREQARSRATELDWRIPRARLHVVGRALSEVTFLVDGRTVDRSATTQRLDPGEHVFVARTLDGAERHVVFFLAEGDSKSVTIDFYEGTVVSPVSSARTKEDSSLSPLVWGGFGVAGAGLAVGIGAAIVSIDKVDALKESCAGSMCPPSTREDIDTAKTYSTISTVGFVTAAIGAVVGVVGLTIPSKRDASGTKKETARVDVGPSSVGIAGSF